MKKILMKAVPDSGWSYIVLICAILNHFIIFGVGMSFSVFFKVLMDNFQTTRASTAWFNSIQSGVFYFSGPLVSILLKKYNWRTLILTGAMLNGLGLSFSFFANSIYFLYISIGILVGLGYGLVHVSAVVAVGAYFTKMNQRSFAQGLSLTGGSLGTLIMPVLTYKLIVKYGFRGTFLILAGLMFQTMVFGCLILPFPPKADQKPKPPAKRMFVWTMPKRGNVPKSGNAAADTVGQGVKLREVENDALLQKEDEVKISPSQSCLVEEKEMVNLRHSRLTFEALEEEKVRIDDGSNEIEDDSTATLKQSDLILNPKCLLFILMSAAWTASIFIVVHLLFDFLIVDRGITPSINAAWIFSVIMISAMAGNVFAAVMGIFVSPDKSGNSSENSAEHKEENETKRYSFTTAQYSKCWIFNLCTLVHGLMATPLLLASKRYDMLCLVAVCFGFPYGIKMALGPTICVDLFGVKNLPFIYGYTMLASGTGILVSPPLGGFLVDLTKNYVVTFWLSAGLSVLSCILFTILLTMETRKKARPITPPRLKIQQVYKEKFNDTTDDSLLNQTPSILATMPRSNEESMEIVA